MDVNTNVQCSLELEEQLLHNQPVWQLPWLTNGQVARVSQLTIKSPDLTVGMS